MTGWRLGYIAGPKHFVAACNKIQSQVCCIPIIHRDHILKCFTHLPCMTCFLVFAFSYHPHGPHLECKSFTQHQEEWFNEYIIELYQIDDIYSKREIFVLIGLQDFE